MKQIYSNYTAEDREVWKILFERQMNNLERVVSSEYLEGIRQIGFNANRIPHFGETDEALGAITGWNLHVVPNIISVKDFFELLSQKKFSATTWLRKMSQLDYIEEPDMFHDVFGHVPILTNADFCRFALGLSEIAMKHINNTEVLDMLGRMYWFTIEFGLIREKRKLKIYGAGIISSAGETKHCMSDKVEVRPFNACEILLTPFQNDRIQDKYFVIDSYQQLFNSLPEISKCIDTTVFSTTS